MSDSKLAQEIYERWESDLAAKDSKDRRSDKVQENFDELFYELWKIKVPYDVAKGYIRLAAAAHMPNRSVEKNTYNKLKASGIKVGTEQEFIEDWRKKINSQCSQSFFSFFDIANTEEENEEKVYGNMSAKEYIAQRRYANAYPIMDLAALKEKWKAGINNVNEYFEGINLADGDDENGE